MARCRPSSTAVRVMRARARVDEPPSLARIAELDGVSDGIAPEFAAVVQRTW